MWYHMLGRILHGNAVGKMLSKLKAPLKTCAVPPADLPRLIDYDQDGRLRETNVTTALGGVQQWRVREIRQWLETYGDAKFAGLQLNRTLIEEYAAQR